jgi:hypothetical protein
MTEIKRKGGSVDQLKAFVLKQKNLDCSKIDWKLYEKEFTKDKCPMSYGAVCLDHSKVESTNEYKAYCSTCKYYKPTENRHECLKHGIVFEQWRHHAYLTLLGSEI